MRRCRSRKQEIESWDRLRFVEVSRSSRGREWQRAAWRTRESSKRAAVCRSRSALCFACGTRGATRSHTRLHADLDAVLRLPLFETCATLHCTSESASSKLRAMKRLGILLALTIAGCSPRPTPEDRTEVVDATEDRRAPMDAPTGEDVSMDTGRDVRDVSTDMRDATVDRFVPCFVPCPPGQCIDGVCMLPDAGPEAEVAPPPDVQSVDVTDVADDRPCDWFYDEDSDGYGDGMRGAVPMRCDATPARFARRAGDCNDRDSTVNPGANERCDGIDSNCDGFADNNPVVPDPIVFPRDQPHSACLVRGIEVGGYDTAEHPNRPRCVFPTHTFGTPWVTVSRTICMICRAAGSGTSCSCWDDRADSSVISCPRP